MFLSSMWCFLLDKLILTCFWMLGICVVPLSPGAGHRRGTGRLPAHLRAHLPQVVVRGLARVLPAPALADVSDSWVSWHRCVSGYSLLSPSLAVWAAGSESGFNIGAGIRAHCSCPAGPDGTRGEQRWGRAGWQARGSCDRPHGELGAEMTASELAHVGSRWLSPLGRPLLTAWLCCGRKLLLGGLQLAHPCIHPFSQTCFYSLKYSLSVSLF